MCCCNGKLERRLYKKSTHDIILIHLKIIIIVTVRYEEILISPTCASSCFRHTVGRETDNMLCIYMCQGIPVLTTRYSYQVVHALIPCVISCFRGTRSRCNDTYMVCFLSIAKQGLSQLEKNFIENSSIYIIHAFAVNAFPCKWSRPCLTKQLHWFQEQVEGTKPLI